MNEDLIARLTTMPLHQLYMVQKDIEDLVIKKETEQQNYLQYCEQKWD
jgi:hypothetical protein